MVPSAAAFFCFCVMAVYSIDGEESRKFKRDVSGLVSFPRIGRSDHLWRLGGHNVKRQSLVSFPRTGRSDTTTGSEAESRQLLDGLWMSAPRLGQADRKDFLDGKMWTLVQIKDLADYLRRASKVGYPKRIGGESSEDTG